MKPSNREALAVKKALTKLRTTLRAELRRTEAAFDKHNKKYNCNIGNTYCFLRAKYQERIATLSFAIIAAGGVADRTHTTTIED